MTRLMREAGMQLLAGTEAGLPNLVPGCGPHDDPALPDANPLDDITNTSRNATVIANGRPFERPELNALLRNAEQPAPPPVASPAP